MLPKEKQRRENQADYSQNTKERHPFLDGHDPLQLQDLNQVQFLRGGELGIRDAAKLIFRLWRRIHTLRQGFPGFQQRLKLLVFLRGTVFRAEDALVNQSFSQRCDRENTVH